MRLSNLEEGSYNNTPEPKKMQVTVADKKANTEAWKRYQAGDSRYEFKNPTTEAEVTVDNEGNVVGYLDTIDEYVAQLFKLAPELGMEGATAKKIAYRIQNAVDDIKTRELGLKPSNIRSQYNETDLNESGPDESVKNIDEILVKMGADAPSDIIADIMHWIDAHPGENLEDLIRQANGYYNDELEEGKSPHKKGTAKYKKHMAAMHAEGTHSDAKPIYDLVGSLGAGKIELADNPIFHNLVRFLDADTIEKFVAYMRKEMGNEKSLNEFGPDERYLKIGNNTMIANKKTGSVSSTLSLGGDKTATVNNHLNKDGSAGKIRASGTVNGVKFKASNNINGTAPKASASMRGITINASEEPKVREAGSPWTTTGKHPEKMTTDELWDEIAVFDHIQDRGERLTPKDMMRLDSLFSYLDTAEMNEQIKRKADSMMESAVWKAKRNK